MPPTPITTHQHPLENLFFDLDGRLWVERSVSQTDTLRKADVYGPRGDLLVTVRWPQRIDLTHGAIRRNLGYGISIDSLEVHALARLTFQIPDAG